MEKEEAPPSISRERCVHWTGTSGICQPFHLSPISTSMPGGKLALINYLVGRSPAQLLQVLDPLDTPLLGLCLPP